MIADKVHEFARGASFEAVMSLPVNIADDYFLTWQVVCQLRKLDHATADGFISDIDFRWIDGEPNKFTLTQNDTDKWPLGMAELDVLFIHTSGRKIRTKALVIKIRDGVSKE
jgi:hypothetical protein